MRDLLKAYKCFLLTLPFHWSSSAWLPRVSLPTQLPLISLHSSSSTSCCCCPFTHPLLPALQLCKFPENLQLPQSFCQFCKCLCPLQAQGEAQRLCSELQPVQCTSRITGFSCHLPCDYKQTRAASTSVLPRLCWSPPIIFSPPA